MGDPVTGIMVGSVVFVVVGIIAYCVIDSYVKKSFTDSGANSFGQQLSSKRTLYFENRGTLITSIIVAIIGMWLMWVTCYMHQMYPLITPILHEH